MRRRPVHEVAMDCQPNDPSTEQIRKAYRLIQRGWSGGDQPGQPGLLPRHCVQLCAKRNCVVIVPNGP